MFKFITHLLHFFFNIFHVQNTRSIIFPFRAVNVNGNTIFIECQPIVPVPKCTKMSNNFTTYIVLQWHGDMYYICDMLSPYESHRLETSFQTIPNYHQFI